MQSARKNYLEASRKFLRDAHELSSKEAKKAFLYLSQQAAERASALEELEHYCSEYKTAVSDIFQLEVDLGFLMQRSVRPLEFKTCKMNEVYFSNTNRNHIDLLDLQQKCDDVHEEDIQHINVSGNPLINSQDKEEEFEFEFDRDEEGADIIDSIDIENLTIKDSPSLPNSPHARSSSSRINNSGNTENIDYIDNSVGMALCVSAGEENLLQSISVLNAENSALITQLENTQERLHRVCVCVCFILTS